jgi:hypothetical protein
VDRGRIDPQPQARSDKRRMARTGFFAFRDAKPKAAEKSWAAPLW